MKRLIATTVLCWIMLGAVGATRGAGGPNELTAEEKAAGWRLLFDGTSAELWRGWNLKGLPAGKGWSVADGCLKCAKTNGRPNGGGGDLVTVEEFTDFEFRWEWRITKGGNSGVEYFLLKRDKGAKPLFQGDDGSSLVGHEYQLLDDDAYRGGKNGPDRMTAAFYDVIAPGAAKKLRPVGEFNESGLVVRGNHVEHWLNGAKVLEYELGSPRVSAAIAKSKYKGVAGFGAKRKSAILLQDHGEEIAFRNLKILEIKK
ncbi:MAG: hypothetical protein JWN40_5128 [Phycisphaerales bacterium]|nr:hypothetical protein [Phycisphaerales bacterium]